MHDYSLLLLGCEKMDLRTYCKLKRESGEGLTSQTYASILLDITMGMHYLHLLKIAHRDMNMGIKLIKS
jgi:hypothetical protein